MINEQIFLKMTKEYNKELNKKIKINNWKDLSELKLRQVLTEEIKSNEKYNNISINIKYIKEILEKNDYLGLHKELQKLFQEYIPFITIRRVIQKINQYGIELVFNKIEEHKHKGYSESMCYIR